MDGELVHNPELARAIARYLVDQTDDAELLKVVKSEITRMQNSGVVSHIVFYHALCTLQMHCAVLKNSVDSKTVSKMRLILGAIFSDEEHLRKVETQVFSLLMISSGSV